MVKNNSSESTDTKKHNSERGSKWWTSSENYHQNKKKHNFGRGSKWCKRCGDFTAVIQKYDLALCRRCFREVAESLGFKKLR